MSHEDLDRRSLELHRAIVEKLRSNPALVEVARENLRRWLGSPRPSSAFIRCYGEWLEILNSKSLEELMRLLLEDSENARRLRQNTPFAGVLSPEEVRRIKQIFRHAQN